MSKSTQKVEGTKVGGDVKQASNAEMVNQSVRSSEIAGSLTQESLSAKRNDIEGVLQELLTAIERLGLSADDKADVKVQAETAKAQMKAKKPNPTIVTESLKSIWETLKGAATAAATSGAGLLVKELMNKFAGFLR